MGLGGSSQTKVFALPRDIVWEALGQACNEMGWKVLHSSESEGVLEAKSRAAFLCPLGVAVRVALTGSLLDTEVRVEAKGRGQMIDYGQSSREANRLLDALANALARETATPVLGGPDSCLCPQCGAVLSDTAKFCGKCGVPVI